jgi:hypothetical protein
MATVCGLVYVDSLPYNPSRLPWMWASFTGVIPDVGSSDTQLLPCKHSCCCGHVNAPLCLCGCQDLVELVRASGHAPVLNTIRLLNE